MFNGKRSFKGRQGEQLLNEEFFKLYEIMKHFLDVPPNPAPTVGPESDLEKGGALWLDRQTYPGNAHLMYKDSDKTWKPMYDNWFKIIKDIRCKDGKPDEAIEGELWINDNGVLNWFNGSAFVPIKSRLADISEFNANAFENFLIIDKLEMTGGYIIENMAQLAKAAGGINEWKPNIVYKDGDIVYYSNNNDETDFYQYTNANGKWPNNTHTSALKFEDDIINGFVKQIDLKAQYLIPNGKMDKVFINNLFADESDYTKMSDVCIQLSLEVYNGKTIAAVHVNPVALKNIKKRMISINKDKNDIDNYGTILVGPQNTEYYGFKNGFGQILLKEEDYTQKANGIKLSDKAIDLYEFVYAITYEFELRIKNEGILYKDTINLSNQTSIYVGQIDPDDKLLVFVQGLCLEDFFYSYDAYDKTGLVRFNGYDKDGEITNDPKLMVKPIFESKTEVAILRFKKKTNVGVFTSKMLSNNIIDANETNMAGTYKDKDGKSHYRCSINIPTEYKQPLVFVQGPNLNMMLGDYIVKDGKAIINNAVPGSAYYIVDAVRADGFNMYVGQGTVTNDRAIHIADPQIINGECQPLLFVDGFYISIRDFSSEDSKTIKIHGLVEGQTYTLLKDMKDEKNQLLFDGEVSFTTIPLIDEINDAVVYVGNSVIIDGSSCYSTSISTANAINGEIRNISWDGLESWRIYDEVNDRWNVISDKSVQNALDLSSAGYTVDQHTINLLQNFGDVACTYYAYRFADNIEKPLIKGYTTNYENIGDETFYKIDYRHSYEAGRNAISVWMNGVKQEIKEHTQVLTSNDGKKIAVQGFLIPKPTDAFGNELEKKPTCFYVIENPERGEHMSCSKEILTNPVGLSTFITNNTILAPGILRVFIDGYRQSQNAYEVNNMNTITFVEPPLTIERNQYSVTDEYGKKQFVKAEQMSKILVEIRQDYKLREKTIELTKENLEYIIQGAIAIFDSDTGFKDNTRLPIDLFLSKSSEICIYVNGAAYGQNFTVIRNQDNIILTNIEIVKSLKEGDKITFEWR